eukprot:TRINITY_DN1785_c0_g1_i1.p1 TRINITY_DN1785_c0_g1~~TRINITY_DN1785_c0_g1_i1.p1  ORF type:complete len:473 (-),score=120.55 TRINITY_DN1785_c0_g1_i1:62-1480(-)
MVRSVQRVICAVVMCLVVVMVKGYGEADSAGHPTYQERAAHVFSNAARVAPSQYKTNYMAGYNPSPANILTSAKYPAVKPMYLEPKLTSSAFYHSNDMGVNGCFQHNSCDGTDTFARIRSYYSCSGGMGENIAAGAKDPLDAINMWICDATNGACAADGSGNDGHRSNIMGGGFTSVGLGFQSVANSPWTYYWTQDFGGAQCTPLTTPIYGGSHYFPGSNTKFMVIYYATSGTPSVAKVVIDGTAQNLAVDTGAAGKALYSYSRAKGSACSSYYFTFTDAQGTWRYPDSGFLSTYGEGTCTTSFTAGSNPPAPPPSTPSPSPSTPSPSPSTPSPSPSGSTHWMFDSAFQNGWTTFGNGFSTSIATVLGKSAVNIPLGASGANNAYVFFQHSKIPNQWKYFSFMAAADSATTAIVYFNGLYTQNVALTKSYQNFTYTISQMGSPANVGDPAIIFQNNAATKLTIYVYNMRFYS